MVQFDGIKELNDDGSDLQSHFSDFCEDLLRENDPQYEVFFRKYAEISAENGDTSDLKYAHARRDSKPTYQVDGYSWEPDLGELHLAICDFDEEGALKKINFDRVKQLFNKVKKFCELSIENDFLKSLEEESAAFEIAQLILQVRNSITRIRLVIFSNSYLITNKKTIELEDIIGVKTTCNIFDFKRFHTLVYSQNSNESIELDILELNDEPLKFIEANGDDPSCVSYLLVMPGKLLTRVYGLFGSRLMEQNVRTFLQSKTKTNKGIIKTATETPQMFFAFNNGITATASSVDFSYGKNGNFGISKINNLQIVNGGQTTASLLYADDRNNIEIDKIFIQMKLTVIDEANVGSIVRLISRYANTQNKVSEADFFSNHEYHLEMQKISRELYAPRVEGSLVSSRWYYERTRGQYKNDYLLKSPSDRKKFESLYPKEKVVGKTDAAKYHMTFECFPHIVSRGAQKCFVVYADDIDKKWGINKSYFNENFYKDLICKVIIFRWLDGTIGKSAWYSEYRSLKAPIVTYTLAWLVNFIRLKNKSLDFNRVWINQSPMPELCELLNELSFRIASKLKGLGETHGHVSEFAKNSKCWELLSKVTFDIPIDISKFVVDFTETAAGINYSSNVEFDHLLNFIANSKEKFSQIENAAKKYQKLSPNSVSAFDMLRQGRIVLSRAQRNSLIYLFNQLDQLGVGPSSWKDK